METFKIGILEPKGFSEKAISTLEEFAVVEMFDGSEVNAFIEDKTAIFIRLNYNIDDDFVRNAPNLRFICSPTTGLNHISVTDEKIKVISLKGEQEFLSTIRATPEHIFGLTIALLRNYSGAFMSSTNAAWNRDLYIGYEIYGSKVGIIGLGRIGKILASYFNAFGATVGYYDIARQPKYEGRYKAYSSIDELISKSEIIILTANYISENEQMINAKYLKVMQGKYFINAARGELVDETVLIEEIKKDTFKGIAIDVLAGETQGLPTLTKLLPLCENHNLIITPHIGGATHTSMRRTEEFIAEKLFSIDKDEK